MKTRYAELAVGAFVIVCAFALFVLAMRVSGLSGQSLGANYQLTARFDNISGLKERAKVTIAGVKVGQVSQIKFDPISNKAVVTLTMDKGLTTFTADELKKVEQYALEDLKYSDTYQQADATQQKSMQTQLMDNMKSITSIDEDAFIKVATNGIIGEKYLKIEPGGGYVYLPQNGQFADSQTQGTIEIEDLVNKFITSNSANQNSAANSSNPTNSSEATDADGTVSFTE